MDYNYHTHTKLCGHATGEIEDYIKRAIKSGIKHLGFSEHIPFEFPHNFHSSHRLKIEDVAEYIGELKRLREKYGKEIEIIIGFEMEYYPDYFDKMLENAKKWGAEFLILGQHYIYNECPDSIWSGRPTESESDLKEYVECVIKGIKSGVFTYVAHPDLFHFKGSEEAYREEMTKLCKASKKYNIPVEINFYGIRDTRFYPYDKFWELAGQEKCPVTFGTDAHDTASVFDGVSLLKAKEMVSKYKLNYIGKPQIIKIN